MKARRASSRGVEGLHVYSEGQGPSPIPLPTELEWVSLAPTEASTYCELRLLLGDLDFAVSVLTRLVEDWPSGDALADSRDPQRDDHRARWNAALVAYARAFSSRVGEHLEPSLFEGDAARLHAFFMRLRNRHVAHSVSDYERVGVLIALTRDDPALVEGLLDHLSTEQSPGRPRVQGLLRLANLARDELLSRLEVERTRLLGYARSIAGDLEGRPRIDEIAGSPFGDDLRKRRT